VSASVFTPDYSPGQFLIYPPGKEGNEAECDRNHINFFMVLKSKLVSCFQWWDGESA
jgi:hypothetical protein